jgi:hypothetical protein
VRIYFDNGSGSTATHLLSVNGGSPVTVTYPSGSAWGNFSSSQWVDVTVTLNNGANTLQFTKGTNWTEIDRIVIL